MEFVTFTSPRFSRVYKCRLHPGSKRPTNALRRSALCFSFIDFSWFFYLLYSSMKSKTSFDISQVSGLKSLDTFHKHPVKGASNMLTPVADAVCRTCIFPCGGYRQIFLSESAQLTRHALSAAHPKLYDLIDPPKAAAVFGRCSEKNVAIFPQSASSLPMYREYSTDTPAPSILEKTLAHLTIYEDLARAETPEQFELIFRRLQQEWIAIGGLVRVLAENFESSLLTTIFGSWLLLLRKGFILVRGKTS
jgi:hypothetical protein